MQMLFPLFHVLGPASISSWRHGAEIAEMQRARAEITGNQSELTLTTLQADAARITKKSTEFAASQSTVVPRMSAFTKELRNAKPLPVCCVPDADRVRDLSSEIEVADKASLDTALATPCLEVARPATADFDAWQE